MDMSEWMRTQVDSIKNIEDKLKDVEKCQNDVEALEARLNLTVEDLARQKAEVDKLKKANEGIFTAPVNGVYYFSFSTFGYNTHVMGAILMKNAVHQVSTYDNTSVDGSDSSSNSVVLQLFAGDKVHMQLWNNGRVFDNLNGHTTFSGYLLFTV
ncbi:hypothetical protein PAMP_015878 [Pampus punctatissimus]